MVEWKKILQNKKSNRPVETNGRAKDNYESAVVSAHINGGQATPHGAAAKANDTNEPPSNEPPVQEAGASASASASVNQGDTLPDDVKNYYYPDMDMDSAKQALQGRPAGTFLLRRSQCQDAKFTLSVRSDKHVFNVRIFNRPQASNGGYHLDAPAHLRKCFPTMTDLLRYYSQAPRELIALCAGEGIDERSTFKLMFPLSRSESALNLVGAGAGPGAVGGDNEARSRPVTRQTNGGSLKAMVKWL